MKNQSRKLLITVSVFMSNSITRDCMLIGSKDDPEETLMELADMICQNDIVLDLIRKGSMLSEKSISDLLDKVLIQARWNAFLTKI